MATYDIDALKADLPTAKELARYVYDKTGMALDLIGKPKDDQYLAAKNALEGKKVPAEFITDDNPYVEKSDLIPEDPLKEVPAKPKDLIGLNEVTRFGTNTFPHPHPEWKAQDVKAQVVFRKYDNGIITYEILGPIAKVPVGQKINKFGAKVPEKLTWIDPRTGEQIVRKADGNYTPIGTRLRAFMIKQKVNKSNQWDTWIDRDFIISDGATNENDPWAV